MFNKYVDHLNSKKFEINFIIHRNKNKKKMLCKMNVTVVETVHKNYDKPHASAVIRTTI